MKSKLTQEIIVSLVLVALMLALLNPFNTLMLKMSTMTILALMLVAFGLFASYVLREDVHDERDGVHRMFAGRTAFLAGSFTIMAGLAVQAFHDTIDSWLVIALVVMVLTKLGARFYSDRNF